MKRYIKPEIEVIVVGSLSRLLDASEIYNQPGSGKQLAKGQHAIIEDDDEDLW